MGFETALWTGVSGLFAAQKQMEVAAHNVANVNTPGYSRQRVELQSNTPAPGTFGVRGDGQMGTGVTIADVIRVRNSLTDSAYRNEAGLAAGAEARAEVLRRAETALGPVNDGVPQALSKFWSAWDALSLNANDVAARQGVLDDAAELAGQLRGAASTLDRLTMDVGHSITEAVDNINRLAKQAGELNQAIKEQVAANHTPNDLMDLRDQVIDQLAELTGGIVQPGDLGTTNIFVSNRPLVFEETANLMTADTGTPAAAKWAIDNKVVTSGGRLGALVELKNQTLPGLQAELDDFANGMRDLINAAHTAGFDQDGAAGLAFFTSTGAGDIAVNDALTVRKVAASATGAVNDASNALAIGGMRTAPAVGSNTLSQSILGFAGRLGGLSASAQATAETTRSGMDNIRAERAEQSSVSIDEELANIVRFQHAYSAAAKIIQVVDQSMDELINLVRR